MFERLTERASKVMCLAYEESERLRHDYVGPEHALVGLAQQEDSRAAAILGASGLGPDVLRAGMDHLVAQGILPGPWRNKADLLQSVGIDLASVQQAVEESFGMEAVLTASRNARSRSWLREDWIMCTSPISPLSGKAMLVKRAFQLAGQEADELGLHEIRPQARSGWRSRLLGPTWRRCILTSWPICTQRRKSRQAKPGVAGPGAPMISSLPSF